MDAFVAFFTPDDLNIITDEYDFGFFDENNDEGVCKSLVKAAYDAGANLASEALVENYAAAWEEKNARKCAAALATYQVECFYPEEEE